MSLLLDKLTADESQPLIRKDIDAEARRPQSDKLQHERIAVVGLGYVGLPLAVCLADHFASVAGLDISETRVQQLQSGHDTTNEVAATALMDSGLNVTGDRADIADATFYIVTVPTPITAAHQPDLSPLEAACASIGPYLKKGDLVVFESTVYPGVTEDVCGPLLAAASGLRMGEDFHLGYSPERINPGDKTNTIDKITKIVAGDTPDTLARMIDVYGHAITAGLYPCASIKVAEGAKVLENTQRDVNIALMNELSLICDKVGVNTQEVIDAAATKWNFVPFQPGLVGGHCIGVDPYYLASLAEQIGLHPQVILSGRRINDSMVGHVAHTALRLLIEGGGNVSKAKIGVFGISFKEDVPDIRNSKAVELIRDLRNFGLDPLVHDPHCSAAVAKSEGILLNSIDVMDDLDLMIVTGPHGAYRADPAFLCLLKDDGALMDVRGVFRDRPEAATRRYWSL